jgi:3-oxoacyl-[acyl-carrier protein] reductase
MKINEAKVLITGGTSGIGYETAKHLKSLGALVTICGRDESKLKNAMEELDVFGKRTDVAAEQEVIDLVAFAKEKMGGLNVLVNNAGIGSFAPLAEINSEDFKKIWETNVLGAMVAGREAATHFIKENTGNIINIASTAGHKGFANGSAYCSSKFALVGLTECWRAELRKYNVRVMMVNPSEVVTEFGGSKPEERENIGRKLKPTEIAHTIVSMLQMNDVGFITDATVWATNP